MRTKKMPKENLMLIVVSVVLGLTLLATFIALAVFVGLTNTYSIQLENVYKRSFYELSTNINDIELDMSKLVAVNGTTSKREVLSNIYNSCQTANTNISNLPIQNNKIDKVNNMSTCRGFWKGRIFRYLRDIGLLSMPFQVLPLRL